MRVFCVIGLSAVLAASACGGASSVTNSDGSAAGQSSDGSVGGKDSTRADGAVSGDDGALGQTTSDGAQAGGDASMQGDAGGSNIGDLTCDISFGAKDACGGDLKGTWTYKRACATDDMLGEIASLCQGLSVKRMETTPSGTLTADGTTFTADRSVAVSMSVRIPFFCALAAGGGCQAAATAIEERLDATATCKGEGLSDCDCDIDFTYARKDVGAYTISGSVIELAIDEQRYHYCVKGDVLRYKGLKDEAADEYVSYVLTRR